MAPKSSKMVSPGGEWVAPSAKQEGPVPGEVAAERRPKLKALLLAKMPELTDEEIDKRRLRGLFTYYDTVWAARDRVRIPHPRDVDAEDIKLRVDQHLWASVMDTEVDGAFPWAGVKPPRSHPHEGYAEWFEDDVPPCKYPPEEDRRQLWDELLSGAPYYGGCGPFEVVLPSFGWDLVTKQVIWALQADLPAGIKIATRPVDDKKPKGLMNLAIGLPGPLDMGMWSKLRVARTKSDFLRCWVALRVWAEKLSPDSQMPLEDFFLTGYIRNLGLVASQVPGCCLVAPEAPEGTGFVESEGRLALPAPSQSTGGPSAVDSSNDGSSDELSTGEASDEEGKAEVDEDVVFED